MSNVVRIRHTSGVKQRLDDAHKVMGLADKLSSQLEGIFNEWAKVKVTDSEVKKLIQLALCPNTETLFLIKNGAENEVSTVFENTVEDAFAYAMASESQQMKTTKGTLFGAYNAVFKEHLNKFKPLPEVKKLYSAVLLEGYREHTGLVANEKKEVTGANCNLRKEIIGCQKSVSK